MTTHAYIGHGGITAAVEGYALQPRADGGYWLWYLSMVGSAREAVRSIWAGLVASPPKQTTLMLPATTQHDIIHSAVWAAPRPDSDGWWSSPPLKLPRSAAYQMVLLPRIALRDHEAQRETPPQKPNEPVPPPPIAPFVLLDTPERDLTGLDIADLFAVRLDKAGDVPTKPQWAEWLWATGVDAGWITPLVCGGSVREAYLCRIDRAGLVAAIGAAVSNRTLPEVDTCLPTFDPKGDCTGYGEIEWRGRNAVLSDPASSGGRDRGTDRVAA